VDRIERYKDKNSHLALDLAKSRLLLKFGYEIMIMCYDYKNLGIEEE